MSDRVIIIEAVPELAPGRGLVGLDFEDATIEAMRDFAQLELLEFEAVWRKAVEVVFDAVPGSAWIRA